jgi:hypothetical protein
MRDARVEKRLTLLDGEVAQSSILFWYLLDSADALHGLLGRHLPLDCFGDHVLETGNVPVDSGRSFAQPEQFGLVLLNQPHRNTFLPVNFLVMELDKA